MSQSQFAKHRGISRSRVSILIRDGKIPPACFQMVNGKRVIDPEKADLALSDNLDQIHNPRRNQYEKKIKIQSRAADYASEIKDWHKAPWPVWAARYIGALADLSPEQVEVTQMSKNEWSLSIHDFDTETGALATWTVKMIFDLKL